MSDVHSSLMEIGFQEYIEALSDLGATEFEKKLKVISTSAVSHYLEKTLDDLNTDPVQILKSAVDEQINFISMMKGWSSERDENKVVKTDERSSLARTQQLFEDAWTVFDEGVYLNSVSLVDERLKKSGITSQFIEGKRCLDSGCGTGRLSISLAKLGAKEIVSYDFGQNSLEFFGSKLKEIESIRPYKSKINTQIGDVTDLSHFQDACFDFVATNGVLHHTSNPDGGLKEHFRVLAPDGILFIYLYGAGGLYWEMYDQLRDVMSDCSSDYISDTMLGLGLRQGFVYTYLDNVLAPRTYHKIEEVVELLRSCGEFSWWEADGGDIWDSPSKTRETKFGQLLLGPDGEVRIVLRKH